MNLKLKGLLNAKFGSQLKASQELTITPAQLSHLVQNKRPPYKPELQKLRRAFGRYRVKKMFQQESTSSEQ